VAKENNEKKSITRYFTVKKKNGNPEISNTGIEGVENNRKGERSQVDGELLLNQIFPFEIRKYSMFKGEAELDIFKDKDTLMTLINSFSSAKYYEKYAAKAAFLRERAEKAVEDATKTSNKNLQEYKKLELAIEGLHREREKILTFIESAERQRDTLEGYIKETEKFAENAEALDTINKRIKKIEEQINTIEGHIDEKYTIPLFDEKWILMPFEKVHQEFTKKVADLNNIKRELQTEFDKQKGVKEGRRQATADLFNNTIPLPVGVPSKAHMEEMLKDQICKICNRPAKKGSEAYNFMEERLKEYLQSQNPKSKTKEEPVLYPNDYLTRLFAMGTQQEDGLAKLREIKENITDRFEFNKKRKQDLEECREKLEKELAERDKIVGLSNIGADRLTDVFKNYNGWYQDLKRLEMDLNEKGKKLQQIDNELKDKKGEKDQVDINSAQTFLINTKNILRDIETIISFNSLKKFDEFIELMQLKSNEIFQRINLDAFTGIIVFEKRVSGGKTTINLQLQEADGNILHRPNQSLLTSMHISILFAISELAAELKEEGFPMIFDAPTSSFGETKTGQFLNLIYETEAQKILLVKDFLETDPKTRELKIKPEFKTVQRDKAFWIRLKRPFDRKNLKTLDTEIIPL